MKLYVERGDAQSIIPGLITTIIFMAPNFFFAFYATRFTSLIELAQSKMGILALASPLIGLLGLYFVFYLLKPPKIYNAKLKKKYTDTTNGKTYYSFFLEDENYPMVARGEYKCYSYDAADLRIGETYQVRIKEFHWRIISVDTSGLIGNVAEAPHEGLDPTQRFLCILATVIGLFFVSICSLGIIYYPEYWMYYVPVALAFGGVSVKAVKLIKGQ